MRAVLLIGGWYAARRLAAGLVLVALAALAGGAVLAAVAGAFRTDSAYARLEALAREPDLVVAAQGDPAAFDPSVVATTPGVNRSGVVDGFAMLEVLPNGTFDTQSVPALLAPEDETAFNAIGRPVLDAGRQPHPDAADEIVISEFSSGLGHPLGSTIEVCVFDYADLGELGGFARGGTPTVAQQRSFAASHCELRSLRVVGISRPGPDEVVEHPTSDTQQFFTGSPALDASLSTPRGFSFVDVDLDAGTDVSAFIDAVLARESPHADATIQANSVRATVVSRTVAPYVRALLLFAAAVAIAAIGVLGPSIMRWTATPDSDREPLTAMGMTSSQLRLVGLLRGAVVGIVAAAGAVGIAVSVSGRFPIGIARQIEPHPGVHLDLRVVLIGAAAIVALCTAMGGVVLRNASHPAGQGSRVADRLQAAGASPARVAGVRSALGREGGAWSAISGVTIAIVAVTGALTFQAGLGRMLDTPARYGWTWDAVVDSHDTAIPRRLVTDLENSPIAQSVTLGRRTSLLAGGAAFPTFTFSPLRGSLFPLITQGRAPHGDNEIALGQQTLERLHKSVGDELTVRAPNGVGAELTIVGRTLLPLDNVGQDLSVGEGGIIDRPLLDRVGGAPTSLALVDLRPHGSLADLRVALGVGPSAASANGLVLGPTYTADLRGYDAVRQTPLLLAALLAFVGFGVLAHTVLATARRRRRELAVLRCLGFISRDLRVLIRWNAITVVAACLLVGLPIGIAVGRVLWTGFATGLGVPSDALTPTLATAIVAIVAIVGTVMLAVVPGLRASRLRPAAVLRSE